MAHKLVMMEWLYKADQDFGFAESYLKNHAGYFDQICFHFQQAAEKYFKAYIVKFDLPFEKQHDLIKLLKICSGYDSSLRILEEDCRFLNPFYIEARYPDQVFAVCTKEEAENAYHHAQKIRDLIREKLGVQQEITLKDLEVENKKIDEILKKK